MYVVKISYFKTYLLSQIIIILFWGTFYLLGAFPSTDFKSHSDAVFFVIFMSYISLLGAIAWTFMTPVLFNSRLTSDGIVARVGFSTPENLIRWDQMDSVINNWISPCYVVRQKTNKSHWPPSLNLRAAALPKSFFLKDRQGFLAYMDGVLPEDHKLRSYYFVPKYNLGTRDVRSLK